MTIEASTIATVMTDGTQRETATDMKEQEKDEGRERNCVSMTGRMELAVHMENIKHVKSRGNKLPNKLVNA